MELNYVWGEKSFCFLKGNLESWLLCSWQGDCGKCWEPPSHNHMLEALNHDSTVKIHSWKIVDHFGESEMYYRLTIKSVQGTSAFYSRLRWQKCHSILLSEHLGARTRSQKTQAHILAWLPVGMFLISLKFFWPLNLKIE